MKRFTILAVLLVLVGVSTGFALDLKPSVTLEGNETMTFGMDLNTGAIGFDNSTDATLKVFLVADDSSDNHKGTGAIYGSITISDFDLYWVDGNENYNQDKSGAATAELNPDVSATLYIPPFSIGLDSPGMSGDVNAEIEANSDLNDFSNIVLDSIVDNEDSVDTVPVYKDFTPSRDTSRGMSVRYSDPAGMFWAQIDMKTLDFVGLVAGSQTFAAGVELSVTIAPVTLSTGWFYGFGWAGNPAIVFPYVDNPIVGFLSATLALTGIGTANVGVDMSYDPGNTAAPFWGSFYASAQMNFNKEATSFLLLKALYDTHFNGTAVGTAIADDHLDGYVDFEIPSDTLVGPLSVSILGYFLEMLSPDIEYAAKLNTGYKVWQQGDMYVKPMVTVAYGKANALRTGTDAISAAIIAAPTDSIMAVNPAVEIGLAANPLSTLTLGWSSGNLLRTGTEGANLGTVTAVVKITY